MTSPNVMKQGPIDVVKHRWIYVILSVLFVLPGLVFMVLSAMESPTHSPIRLGIDFTGGTILEYGFQKPVQQADLPIIRDAFDDIGIHGAIVQLQQPREGMPTTAGKAEDTNKSDLKSKHITSLVSIRTRSLQDGEQGKIDHFLNDKFGSFTLLQKASIGPSMASEILTNGFLALIAAYVLIVGYLTFRFQFDYALCAIIAMVHDTIFVFGVYAIFGYLFQTEVDSLFITGILTVIGFSVHDTIVVFDRLRENTKLLYSKKLPFGTIANMSINQTLARSINTSLTALLTLVALYVFGGETTRDFVLVMILGIVVGTFSSIFIATLLLAWWREKNDPNSAAGKPALA